MWTKLNPFRTVREILTLWERQIQAQEQANALAVLSATGATLPASITAAAASRLATGFSGPAMSRPNASDRKPSEKPPKKLDAHSVHHVTRTSRIAHQMRAAGKRLHGGPPTPTPTPPPSGSTAAD